MRHTFRLGRGWLPVLGATAALAVIPSVASAQEGGGGNDYVYDAQNVNVPYLAWNGEQVRFEKCYPAYDVTRDDFDSLGDGVPRASLTVEEWTGHQSQPSVQDPTVKMFYSDTGYEGDPGICAQGDAISLNPGMARIEMDITDDAGFLGLNTYNGPAEPFIAHQFLAGWMTLNKPSIKELGASDFEGSSEAASELGDPDGLGKLPAGDKPGYVGVNVSGTIPLDGPDSHMQDLVGDGSMTSVTLPNDWATLAQGLATDANLNDADAAKYWDISGDSPNTDGGGFDGPFETVFGPSESPSVGPFDPTHTYETDLADGTLNSLDAPMPAARVDVSIANGGMGSLQSADKVKTRSRDFEGDQHPTVPGDLDAPFYEAYIPATARPTDESSGIDGAYANNFPGFIDISGGPKYHYWDTYSLDERGGTSQCLNYSPDHNPQGGDGVYRSQPSGDDQVAVYTDEKGEAEVKYVPGVGAYFDGLPGIDKNADGGCDLQDVNPIGGASISAIARYPYKPVSYKPTTSDTLTKTVTSAFDKSLSYAPKGTSQADQVSRIVIAHGQDVDGTPYAGETVCFSVDSNAEGVTRFTGYIRGVYYGGSRSTTDPNGAGSGRTCLIADQNGNAAIEVLDSNANMVNVIADYVDEGLLRFKEVDFSTPQSSGGPVPIGPVTQPDHSGSTSPVQPVPATGTPGTTAPTPVQVAKIDPRLTKLVTKSKAQTATLRFARLVKPVRGRHYLSIRVSSAKSSARVSLSLLVRSGRRSHLVRRTITVRTNHTIKMNVSNSVKKIKGAHLS